MSDFFNKLDQKINEQKQIQKNAKSRLEELKDFFKIQISELEPRLNDYVEQCNKRSMNASCSVNDYSFSFTLKNQNGFFNTIIFHQDFSSDRFQFTNEFMNDDRKKYTSTDGMSYVESSWTQELAIKKVEQTIEDFVFYAKRHGGI
ncbi:hypothetical protein MUC14_004604 [Vibrio parahaemolyticus]|nr:hypothetical protein [Vibrio parahaemolyticus]